MSHSFLICLSYLCLIPENGGVCRKTRRWDWRWAGRGSIAKVRVRRRERRGQRKMSQRMAREEHHPARPRPMVRMSCMRLSVSSRPVPRLDSAQSRLCASQSGRSVAGTATQKSMLPMICVVSKHSNQSFATLFFSSSSRIEVSYSTESSFLPISPAAFLCGRDRIPQPKVVREADVDQGCATLPESLRAAASQREITVRMNPVPAQSPSRRPPHVHEKGAFLSMHSAKPFHRPKRIHAERKYAQRAHLHSHIVLFLNIVEVFG